MSEWRAVACLALLLVQPSVAAFGQSDMRGQTVFERSRPEFAPSGIGHAGFRAFPYLDLRGAYDNNIFAAATAPESDLAAAAEAGVSVRSDWSNHALGGLVFGRATRFVENASEDTEEGGAQATGRLDITRRDTLSGTVAYQRETLSRTDPEERGGNKPSQVDRYGVRASYAHRFNRARFVASSRVERHEFVSAEDRFRDRTEWRVEPRLYYEISPNLAPFGEVAYSHVEYDAALRGLDRDSDGVAGSLGLEFDLTGILSGEALIGYFRTEFDDPTLDEVAGVGGRGRLTWQVSGLTSVLAEFSRGVEQTTRASASSRIRSRGALRLEHELRRNILLEGEAQYTRDEFEGFDRLDDTVGGRMGVNYLLNRHASLSLSYTHLRRTSDVPSAEFTKNILAVSTRFAF